MILDVKPCFEGKTLDFSYELDLSELDFSGVRPFADPVAVSGIVENRADVVSLAAKAFSRLHLVCDRCAEPFFSELSLDISSVLVEKLENPGDAQEGYMTLVENGMCDMDEIVVPALVLEMGMKNLCREDCAGLCHACGKNLNLGSCGCVKKDVDPRLAKLAEFFDNQKSAE